MQRLFFFTALGALAACGPNSVVVGGSGGGSNRNGGGTANGGNGVGGSGASNGGNGGGVSLSGGGAADGCSEDAKIIYVVDTDNTFSSFDPHTNSFHDINALNCPSSGGHPFSMAVARDAFAYVLYDTGEVFKVDTSNAACTATSFTANDDFTQFGMGFSTDAAGGTTDTLFIAGAKTFGTNAHLGKLDTSSFQTTKVGEVAGWPELTGTGSAELWGFFPQIAQGGADPVVAKLDKTSGNQLSKLTLHDLAGTATDWAFAFWGGSFYIFLERDSDISTVVWKLDPATGGVTKAVPYSLRNIVGAGVSTCAPISIN